MSMCGNSPAHLSPTTIVVWNRSLGAIEGRCSTARMSVVAYFETFLVFLADDFLAEATFFAFFAFFFFAISGSSWIIPWSLHQQPSQRHQHRHEQQEYDRLRCRQGPHDQCTVGIFWKTG